MTPPTLSSRSNRPKKQIKTTTNKFSAGPSDDRLSKTSSFIYLQNKSGQECAPKATKKRHLTGHKMPKSTKKCHPFRHRNRQNSSTPLPLNPGRTPRENSETALQIISIVSRTMKEKKEPARATLRPQARCKPFSEKYLRLSCFIGNIYSHTPSLARSKGDISIQRRG